MPKKIKVLRIIARLNIGGPAIHTILLTEGMDKRRFETILATGTTERSEGDMIYLAEEKDVQPVIIPELSRALNIRGDIVAFWKLFCLIKKERPDIIHTHTAKAGTLGRLAGMLYNVCQFASLPVCQFRRKTPEQVKLIHTFHGHILHSYFNKIKNVIFTWIERFLAIFTYKVIAVSKNLKKELLALKIANPKKIAVIPLGLELERYLRIENNRHGNRDCKTIGIIGRLVPVKNHRMFLDAAKKLKDILGFGQRMKFLIVGDGPLRQELERYTKRLDIKQDVTFIGWIKDLEKVYSELDIVALTSLNEGTPVALIEAQAAARPCVATDVGGVRDLLSSKLKAQSSKFEITERGILVGSQDTEGFVQGLTLLLKDAGLRRKMGETGREFARERFSKNRLVRDIEKLYEEIASLCSQ